MYRENAFYAAEALVRLWNARGYTASKNELVISDQPYMRTKSDIIFTFVFVNRILGKKKKDGENTKVITWFVCPFRCKRICGIIKKRRGALSPNKIVPSSILLVVLVVVNLDYMLKFSFTFIKDSFGACGDSKLFRERSLSVKGEKWI